MEILLSAFTFHTRIQCSVNPALKFRNSLRRTSDGVMRLWHVSVAFACRDDSGTPVDFTPLMTMTLRHAREHRPLSHDMTPQSLIYHYPSRAAIIIIDCPFCRFQSCTVPPNWRYGCQSHRALCTVRNCGEIKKSGMG